MWQLDLNLCMAQEGVPYFPFSSVGLFDESQGQVCIAWINVPGAVTQEDPQKSNVICLSFIFIFCKNQEMDTNSPRLYFTGKITGAFCDKRVQKVS